MIYRPKTIDGSVSCSFIYPNTKTIKRNCSESRLPTAPLTLSNNPNIKKIRERQGSNKISVDPELAAVVVKKYILPMFEAKNRVNINKSKRIRLDELDKGKTADTVYNDLKMNEELMAEIEELKKKLAHSVRQEKDAIQKLMSSEENYNNLKDSAERLEINLEFQGFQNSQVSKYAQRVEIRYGLVLEQLAKYIKLYEESESREAELLLMIEKTRSENDIRLHFEYSLTINISLKTV